MRTTGLRTVGAASLGVLLLIMGVATAVGQASSAPDLPAITTRKLIASTIARAARNDAVSGHVAAHIDLGLPALPDVALARGASGLAGLVASLSGDHRLRLWHSADGVRLADLLPASERSLFVSRRDAWAWDFSSLTAYHLGPFPAGAVQAGTDGARAAVELADPLELARRLLESISPSTSVSIGVATRVAGRDAYVLVLEPRTTATLVGRIEIAIDAVRWVPLRVAVVPRGRRAAAVSAAFTSVSFAPIDPSTFAFTPPPGATVRELGPVDSGESSKSEDTESRSDLTHDQPGASLVEEYGDGPARVFGTGWATIVAVRTPPVTELHRAVGGLDLTSFLPFSGPLFSIRLVARGDHGWLVYGAVPQPALAAVEPDLP